MNVIIVICNYVEEVVKGYSRSTHSIQTNL